MIFVILPIVLFFAIVALSAAAKTLHLPRWKVALGFLGLCSIGVGLGLGARDLTKHH
jgi:hypothetical protein